MITLMFDDTFSSEYFLAKPLLDKLDVVACTSVISDYVDKGTGYLSSKQLSELQESGWEIVSHTKTHPLDLRLLSEQEIVGEFKESKIDLEKLQLKVNCVVYPCGISNPLIWEIASRYYLGARGFDVRIIGVPPQFNIVDELNWYSLASVNADDHTLLPVFIELMDTHKNDWIIFYWHLHQYPPSWVGHKRSTVQEKLDTITTIVSHARSTDNKIVTTTKVLKKEFK